MTVAVKDYQTKAAGDAILMAIKELGLNNNEVASALGVNRRTLYRYKNHENAPSPEVREKLGKLRVIAQLLSEIFIDKEAQFSWLYSPVPMLRGQLPIDRILSGELDEVVSVLAGLHSGAYA